jgi:hypothetical protein
MKKILYEARQSARFYHRRHLEHTFFSDKIARHLQQILQNSCNFSQISLPLSNIGIISFKIVENSAQVRKKTVEI